MHAIANDLCIYLATVLLFALYVHNAYFMEIKEDLTQFSITSLIFIYLLAINCLNKFGGMVSTLVGCVFF